MATCSGAYMHEKEREFREELTVKDLLVQAGKDEAKIIKLQGLINVSIGQFRYAQFLLSEAGVESSLQLDEFIKTLEKAIQ